MPLCRIRRTALRIALTALITSIALFGLTRIAASQTRLAMPSYQPPGTTAPSSLPSRHPQQKTRIS